MKKQIYTLEEIQAMIADSHTRQELRQITEGISAYRDRFSVVERIRIKKYLEERYRQIGI